MTDEAKIFESEPSPLSQFEVSVVVAILVNVQPLQIVEAINQLSAETGVAITVLSGILDRCMHKVGDAAEAIKRHKEQPN